MQCNGRIEFFRCLLMFLIISEHGWFYTYNHKKVLAKLCYATGVALGTGRQVRKRAGEK